MQTLGGNGGGIVHKPRRGDGTVAPPGLDEKKWTAAFSQALTRLAIHRRPSGANTTFQIHSFFPDRVHQKSAYSYYNAEIIPFVSDLIRESLMVQATSCPSVPVLHRLLLGQSTDENSPPLRSIFSTARNVFALCRRCRRATALISALQSGRDFATPALSQRFAGKTTFALAGNAAVLARRRYGHRRGY